MKELSLIILIIIVWRGYKFIRSILYDISMERKRKRKTIALYDPEKNRKQLQNAQKEKEKAEKKQFKQAQAENENIQLYDLIKEYRRQYDYYERIAADPDMNTNKRIAAENKKLTLNNKIMKLTKQIENNQFTINH